MSPPLPPSHIFFLFFFLQAGKSAKIDHTLAALFKILQQRIYIYVCVCVCVNISLSLIYIYIYVSYSTGHLAIYAEKNDKYLSNLQNKSFESLIHMLFFYDHLKEKAEQLITEGKINANTAFEFC